MAKIQYYLCLLVTIWFTQSFAAYINEDDVVHGRNKLFESLSLLNRVDAKDFSYYLKLSKINNVEGQTLYMVRGIIDQLDWSFFVYKRAFDKLIQEFESFNKFNFSSTAHSIYIPDKYINTNLVSLKKVSKEIGYTSSLFNKLKNAAAKVYNYLFLGQNSVVVMPVTLVTEFNRLLSEIGDSCPVLADLVDQLTKNLDNLTGFKNAKAEALLQKIGNILPVTAGAVDGVQKLVNSVLIKYRTNSDKSSNYALNASEMEQSVQKALTLFKGNIDHVQNVIKAERLQYKHKKVGKKTKH